jgi:signal transduction histidine kinase
MSLKQKFLLLILGIVLLPVLFLGTLLFIQVEFDWERSPFDMRLGGVFMTRGMEKRLSDNPLDLRESGFIGDQIILNGQGEVLASNSAEFPLATKVDMNQLIQEQRRDLWFFPLEENRILVQIFKDSMMKSDYVGLHTMQFPLIITTIFVSIMTILLLSSLNRSVKILSSAMELVAKGDLDFEYKPNRQDNLGTLGQSFESMRRALKEEKARQSRFLMAVSHDLKTPLASIRGYTEAMLDGMDDTAQKRKDFLKIIDKKAVILQKRVAGLIDLAKMKTGEWLHTLEDLDLIEVLDSLSQGAQQDAQIHGKELVIEGITRSAFPVNMDRELFERMIENLLQNAFIHGEEYARVTLGWEIGSENCTIFVRNQGPVIPSDHQEKIFEPLFREDQGRNTQGSGLGLSSVKHICEAHGWAINLQSDKGLTTFSIVIPRDR